RAKAGPAAAERRTWRAGTGAGPARQEASDCQAEANGLERPLLVGGRSMLENSVRNRIKGHRRVRAGDLVPHEWNYRLHPDEQKGALAALYREVGFARSLLVYELPDGRLKLIDGHLRREMDPDMEVEVEILDVNEEEARELLLSIDPLVQLGQVQEQLYDRLRQTTPTAEPELQGLWEAA